MFTIFNERSRSINGEQQDIYAKIDVQMRKYINLFRQNKDLNAWGVFTVIALHSDGNGWSWPSTPTVQKETGLISEEAISRAIKHLRTVCIEGHVLMHHYRQRMSNGQWGRSYYHVFPEAGGVEYMPVSNLVLWQPPPPQPGVVDPVLDQGGDSLSRTSDSEEPKIKTPRKRDLIFDAIAENFFCLTLSDQAAVKLNGSRISGIKKHLIDSDPGITADELTACSAWLRETRPHLSMPKHKESIADALTEYRNRPTAQDDPVSYQSIPYNPDDQYVYTPPTESDYD